MKLLPTFNVLLIAVQMIAAVQLDQLQQPRFVKVRRNLSNDAGSSETQHSLERRLGSELTGRVAKATSEFEKLGSQSKKLPDLSHLADSQGKISEHNNLATPSNNWPYIHENMLGSHNYQLEQHSEAISNHRNKIEESMASILKHDERLKSVEEALKENKEKMKGDRSGGASNGVLWALAAGTVATVATAGTGIYFQHASSKTMADMADRIQAQQAEINRIKALNGQQGGAMQGQGVAGTTGRGTFDGGLV
ncbi:hypothetical protein NDA12_004332 [Ustilago hordei]|nr:hypothetical protein NDA15_000204 [Ustilago hordei]KAJ1590124.1 hypothetical protein NDA12_004332 [Ustilago hordei]